MFLIIPSFPHPSTSHVGARDHSGSDGREAHRNEETHVQFPRGQLSLAGVHFETAGCFLLHAAPARQRHRSGPTGHQAAVLPHLLHHTQQLTASQGHVLLE